MQVSDWQNDAESRDLEDLACIGGRASRDPGGG
jgi:hypothetical protein